MRLVRRDRLCLRSTHLAIFLCFGIAYCVEQPATEDPAVILQRISDQVANHLSRLPNYTCHQVINRLVGPVNSGLRQRDRVELEVAFIGQEELFARPGDKQIQESSIAKLVPTGAVGNGLFGAHAENIFLGSKAAFDYVGLVEKDGRKAHRYSFRVPLERSTFSVGHNGAEAITAYQGSVWADAVTFELVRFELTADHLPPFLRISSVREWAEYSPVRLRDSEFLLPLHAALEIMDSSGSLSTNEVTLEQCREFTGESSVVFGTQVDRPSTDRKP
jgi:hypothetical protein